MPQKTRIKHLRQHAKKHHEAHLRLKDLLTKPLHQESVLSIFVSTLIIVASILLIAYNWQRITSLFEDVPAPNTQSGAVETKGFELGLKTTYQINGQSAISFIQESLSKVNEKEVSTQGSTLGVETVGTINRLTEERVIVTSNEITNNELANNETTNNEITNNEITGDETTDNEITQNETTNNETTSNVESIPLIKKGDSLMASIRLTNDISKGKHLSKAQQDASKTLQKSLLTTVYLGERAIDISSSIQSDAKLLSQIKNTLDTKLSSYLNQSASRADSLDGYVRLLKELEELARSRSLELQSQINFLNANFQAQEDSIEISEEAFFNNLDAFDGQNADQQLNEFIVLGQQQTEVRAKIGAYEGIKRYYDFFLPNLDRRIRAIEANRDALIAGVTVTEIEGMTLELINRE